MGAMKDYGDYIKSMEDVGSEMNSSDAPPTLDFLSNENEVSSDMAILTISVDVDCKLYCDGDFLDELQADEVKKIPIPLDQHIITIESKRFCEIKVKRLVDVNEVGKKYVLVVDGLKERENEAVQKQENAKEELYRKYKEQEEERQRKERTAKEEQENMRKGKEYYNAHIYDLAIQCFEKVLETSDDSDAMLFIGKCYYGKKWGIPDSDRRNAVNWFIKAANKENAEAYYYLGDCYESGFGVKEKNHQEALRWYKKAAETGNVDAMRELAWQAQNAEEMINWYEKAADLSDTISMRELGKFYSDPYKEHRFSTLDDYWRSFLEKNEYYDIDRAMEWYKKAADLGDADAMLAMGEKYYLGKGVCKDFSKASEWFEKIDGLDDESDALQSEHNKGYYLEKIGDLFDDEHDYVKAMGWYKKAAEFGNTGAMVSIGCMYLNGEGVLKNKEEGIHWCEKAWETDSSCYVNVANIYESCGLRDKAFEMYERKANLGDENAMFVLGNHYYLGWGVHKDYCKAFDLFKGASNDGDYKYKAMNNLGVLYNLGLGVRKDFSKAMECYRNALTEQAKVNIGRMYFLGEGVPQDYYEAKRWYQAGERCLDWSDREFRCFDVGLPEMETIVIWSETE